MKTPPARVRGRWSPLARVPALGLLALLVPLVVGVPSCTSTDCVGFCQKLQSCGALLAFDCDTWCADVSAMNDVAQCADSFDQLVTCDEQQTDLCNDTGRCVDPGGLYDGCWKQYCATNPTDPGCVDLMSSSMTPQ